MLQAAGYELRPKGPRPSPGGIGVAVARPEVLMSRDHRKLRVFALADELVIQIYHETRSFPQSER